MTLLTFLSNMIPKPYKTIYVIDFFLKMIPKPNKTIDFIDFFDENDTKTK